MQPACATEHRRKARLLIADDHTLLAEACKSFLEPEFEVVGIADNGRALLQLASQLKPDVVLLDITMPELNGIEATRRLATVAPRARVLALSMHKDSVYVREILRAGARGYLLKDSVDADLLAAVRGGVNALMGEVLEDPEQRFALEMALRG